MRFPLSSRRHALRLLAAGSAAALSTPLWARPAASPIPLQVWKDPSCGCCKVWIAHMQANGLRVTSHDSGNTTMRARLGLASKFGSCHTAVVGGYVIEGHVHADDVKRLLRDKPKALGLAVPGMPIGSPGMGGPVYGGRRDRYDTLLVQRDGSSQVFRRHA